MAHPIILGTGMDLKIEQLSHSYDTVNVLSDISLQVPSGQIMCVVGPSGCGKSTLLRMIGGLERPSAGHVLQSGDVPPDCLNPLTFVFQDFALLPWRSVAGNIERVLEDHPLDGAARAARVADVLARTNLSDFAKALPRQLSGGMKQSVAIARAIVGKPNIILADEPTGNLDSHMGDEIMEILLRLNQDLGTTIVMVTHDERMAKKTHRLVRLSDGERVS